MKRLFKKDSKLLKEPSVKIDWTSEHKRKLILDIQAYKPTNGSVSQTRVLLIGPVGAGKSSFCNSIKSIFNGQIIKPAPTGNSGCTTQFHTYDVKPRGAEGEPLPIILCDTMGLEETTGAGLHVGDISSILRGHVPDRYQFQAAVPLQPEARAYKKNPGLQDRIHCVVYVIDANKITTMPSKLEDKLNAIQNKINLMGIPQLVLLTKVDEACPAVAKDLTSVYHSLYIHTKLQEASQLLDVPLSCVVPVKNYSQEQELDQSCDILLLSAVYKMLRDADDYFDKCSVKFSDLEGRKVCRGHKLHQKPGSSKLLEKPWRNMDWTPESRRKLLDQIQTYKPTVSSLSQVKVLLIGPVGAGKSSLFNSIKSVFIGRVTNQAMTGGGAIGLTTQFRTYNFKVKEGTLPIIMCDTMGLEETTGEGLNVDDISSMLRGHIKDRYQLNASVALQPEDEAYQKNASLKDRIHCVVYVIGAKTISIMPSKLKDKLTAIRSKINQIGIPQLVLLTKVDEVCPTVAEDLTNVYRSPYIMTKLQVASQCLGVPLSCVVPVKNYTNQQEVDQNCDILLLSAVNQMLRFAEDYFDELNDRFSDLEGRKDVSAESKLLEKPWRNMVWTPKNRRRLLDQIQTYTPTISSLSQVKVLLIGPVGAGKSSLFNSIQSVFKGRVTNQAMTGGHGTSLTTQFRTYHVKGKEGRPLPIILCDTMGLEETTGEGLNVDDISSILRGHVPDRHQFNSAVPLQPEDQDYQKSPGLQDRIHCVVYVIDANQITTMPSKLEDKLNAIQNKINLMGIPQLVLLTKVDEACPAVAEDLTSVYHSLYIKTKLQEASQRLGIPMSCVVPVMNYKHHLEVDQNCDILLLSAVNQMLRLADVYFDEVAVEYDVSAESKLLRKPWRNMDWTPENRRKLLDQIQTYEPTVSSQINVLLIGPVGAGKSSLFNSIKSVFKGRVTNQARTGSSGTSLTTQFRTYHVQAGKEGKPLPITLCDTMGLEETTGAGLNVDDISSMLRGHIPDRYQFNTAVPLQPEAQGYKKSPGLQDRIHCVVYVIDVNKISIMPAKLEDELTAIRNKINLIGIPQLVLLTKVDEACPAVAEDLTNVYHSLYIKTMLQEASQRLAIPLSCVVPVKNYTHQLEVDQNCDILLLTAVDQMLCFAEDCFVNDNFSDLF